VARNSQLVTRKEFAGFGSGHKEKIAFSFTVCSTSSRTCKASQLPVVLLTGTISVVALAIRARDERGINSRVQVSW
jgi:hypothetical protein